MTPDYVKKKYYEDNNEFYETSFAKHVFRPLSFWVASLFIKIGVSPNAVTILSIFFPILIVVGMLCKIESFLFSQYTIFIATIIWVILDYVDGSMARALKMKSSRGHFLDLMSAYIFFCWIFPIISFVEYEKNNNFNVIYFGFFATILTLYSRLIMAKYKEVCNKVLNASDVFNRSSIVERVDTFFSMRGAFLLIWIISILFNYIEIFIYLYFGIYLTQASVLSFKLVGKIDK